MIAIIKNQNENRKSVQRAVSLVEENGGIAYSYEQMLSYARKALDIIRDFPEMKQKNHLNYWLIIL